MPVNAKHIIFSSTTRLCIILDNDLQVFVDYISAEECKRDYQKLIKYKLRKRTLNCDCFGFLLQKQEKRLV